MEQAIELKHTVSVICRRRLVWSEKAAEINKRPAIESEERMPWQALDVGHVAGGAHGTRVFGDKLM